MAIAQVTAASGTETAPISAGAVTSGIWIKGLAANTGKVYVGHTGVTTATGYELAAGGEKFFPAAEFGNLADVHLIGSAASQIVCYEVI
jgi:hypothetical protein